MTEAVRRYRVPDGVIDRTIGTDLLVHRFDTDQVFVLNGDARRVFEAVREERDREAVRARVSSEVFGDIVEIYEQVDRALDELHKNGIIELDERSATPTID